MAEKVGGIYYEVTLDTTKMVDGQRAAQRELDRTTSGLDKLEARLSQITLAVGAYVAATWLVGQSDAYTKLNAQLKLATDGHEQLARAQAMVKNIAQEAQTDLSAVGVLYARISNATKELGVSQQTVGEITRAVSLSMKVSGASAAESASAMLQLSQSFAAGALRGEEFNSVSEAAPRLMKALADGIGVPIGQLKAMAAEGKLTSEVLAVALPKALSDLEKEAQSVQTIGGAFQNLKNEVMLFVGQQAQASGAAALTSQAITTLASNLDLLAAAVYGFAASKIGAFMLDVGIQAAMMAKATYGAVVAQQANTAATVEAAAAKAALTAARITELEATQLAIAASRAEATALLQAANAQGASAAAALANTAATLEEGAVVERTIAATLGAAQANRIRSASLAELAILGQQQARVTAQLTAATAAQATAQGALTAAQGAGGVAAGLATRALGLLGGPIGLITTLLGLGVTAWTLWGEASSNGEGKATAAVERSTSDIIEDLDKQIAKLKERNALAAAGLPGIAKQDTEAAKQLATLQGQIDALQSGKGINGGSPLQEDARVGLLQTLTKQYGELYGRMQTVGDEQQKLEAAGTASKLSQWMTKYATQTERAGAEIAKAKKELGDAFTPELETRIREKHKEPKAKTSEEDSLAKKSAASQAYYQGLVSDNASALGKINAEEQKALFENQRRAIEDKGSSEIYAKARVEIQRKYAHERALLEEKTSQEVADLSIAITTDQAGKIEAVRVEAVRRATAAEKLGTMTHEEAERAKTLATFTAAQERAAIAERLAQTSADTVIAATVDELTKIDLARQESFRRADAAARAGAITFAQAEADKAKAAVEAQNATRDKVMSINPLGLLTKEYEDKLALVRFYEQQMGQAGVDATAFAEQKKLELAQQYQAQRQQLAESEFAMQSQGNQFLMDSLNAMAGTATSAITGLISGTMSAQDAMRSLAGVVLNEAVGALVQIGIQQIKNALIGNTIAAADTARKAANGAVYAASVSAQVAGMSSIAAMNAFAATAAIPIVGPVLAPAAAAAAGAVAAGLGAPAIATAPLAGARQYGGPTAAGSLYRVNETGQPEMFTASNGSQYMMPTKSGRVTPADQVGGGGGVVVEVSIMNNHPTADVAVTQDPNGRIVQIAVNEVANQIATNTGQVWRAMRGATNVQGRVE